MAVACRRYSPAAPVEYSTTDRFPFPGSALAMTTPAVELRQVSKVFAACVRAVDGVSLSVAAGSVVALLGPSGGGKTTVLRLINRLEEPSGGQVLVRGHDVQAQRPEVLRRSIGYVIQEGGLFPHMDVAE